MATWPSTLPDPRLLDYGIEPVDPCVRTNMEAGLPRVRRRTAARDDKVPVSWIFDATQMAAFRAWFDDGTTGAAGGASWFTLAIPLGDANSTDCRFAEMWKSVKVSATRWQVTAKLEVR